MSPSSGRFADTEDLTSDTGRRHRYGIHSFRDLIYVMKGLMREDLMKQYESIINDLSL